MATERLRKKIRLLKLSMLMFAVFAGLSEIESEIFELFKIFERFFVKCSKLKKISESVVKYSF